MEDVRMEIRTLIVDDEPLGRRRVRQLLEEAESITIVGECKNGNEAVAAIKELKPDLVFLDIEMPGKNGFDVLEEVGADCVPCVVFVTAYDEYALQAFDFHAVDYLLKPFDRERFLEAVDRARAELESTNGSVQKQLLSLLEELKEKERFPKRVAVKEKGKVVFVRIGEIDWIESSGNYVRLHVGDTSHLMRSTLSGLEDQLDPLEFIRIHRSILVNVDRIREVHPWFHGDFAVELYDGTRLSLSRTYRPKFEQVVSQFST
jgi:two-component system LytT family response regulator